MVGLVVIAHNPFAAALLDCARHVYGCVPKDCVVIDVMADADPDMEFARARQAVVDVDRGGGVLVLVDMFGATPGNIATRLADAGRVEVVGGVNLPMLMRTLCYRTTTAIADLPGKALAGGASGMTRIASTAPASTLNVQRSFPHDPNASTDAPATDGLARLQDQQ